MPLGTRAVSIVIAPGQEASECPFCHERVKYKAKEKQRKLICNLYATRAHHRRYEKLRQEGNPDALAPVVPPDAGGVWDRVEEWHEDCYRDAGSPYGEPLVRKAPQQPGKRPDLQPVG